MSYLENVPDLGLFLRFFLGTRLKFSATSNNSSMAQGGGGSLKNGKPIGEVGCCESQMAERIH